MSSNLIERVKEKYLTLGESAKFLSVSTVTVWRWISVGRIDAYRLGREVLIEKSVINELQKARKGVVRRYPPRSQAIQARLQVAGVFSGKHQEGDLADLKQSGDAV